MKKGLWIYLFPLAVLGFVGPAVEYSNAIFTTSNRWAFAGMLALGVVIAGRFLVTFRYDVALALAVYVGWCVMTYFWSEAPELSMMKSFALALVSFTLMVGGHAWVSQVGWQRTLDYLYPLVALALLAGVLGQEGMVNAPNDYDGSLWLPDNSNMLGSLANMAVPCLLWQAYRNRESRKSFAIWMGLLVAVVGVLLFSVSRASILATICTCSGFLAAAGIRRNVLSMVIAATCVGVAIIAIPDVYETLIQRYVLKASPDVEADVLYSRRGIWRESYEQAVEGGSVGGGYGVTIGDSDFAGGLTAVGYGREKGNAQLAIVEETGVVGLGLYIILLVVLFRRATYPMRHSNDRDMRVMGGLVLGSLAGLIVQSVFEAWWVAPGSPEAAYFWAMAGVALGLSLESRRQQSALRRAAAQRAPQQSWKGPSAPRRGS